MPVQQYSRSYRSSSPDSTEVFKQSQEIERLELKLEKSRIPGKSDSRQNMEVWKQKQEIERLERELEKSRILGKSDSRQNVEIWKQSQEVERLERELEKQLMLEKSGFHQNTEVLKQQLRRTAMCEPDLRRSRQRAATDVDVRGSRLLRGERVRDEDELSSRLRRLEGYERKGRREYRPRLGRVEVSKDDSAAGREINRYKQGDTPGTVGRSSDQKRESEDKLKVTVVGRGGDDAQEQTISDLSLPGNLEDLLAQWTTLDKQEIQRGQIEAF